MAGKSGRDRQIVLVRITASVNANPCAVLQVVAGRRKNQRTGRDACGDLEHLRATNISGHGYTTNTVVTHDLNRASRDESSELRLPPL